MNEHVECDDVLFTDEHGNRRAAHPLYPLTPAEMQAEIERLTHKCLKLEDERDHLLTLVEAYMRKQGLEMAAQRANDGAE